MAKEKNGGESSAKKSASKKQEHAGDKHEAKAAQSTPAPAAHAESHGAAGHGGHTVDRKEYWKIFVVLGVLTVLEVAVAKAKGHGIGPAAVGLALVGLAVTKATCVGLYYMHLKHETKILKMTIAIPMATPAFYALVLITEAAWRGMR